MQAACEAPQKQSNGSVANQDTRLRPEGSTKKSRSKEKKEKAPSQAHRRCVSACACVLPVL